METKHEITLLWLYLAIVLFMVFLFIGLMELQIVKLQNTQKDCICKIEKMI
jgi:hypothetical protein